MRMLDKSGVAFDFEQLGFDDDTAASVPATC